MNKKPLKYYQLKKSLDYKTEDLESLSISDLKKLADYELRQYLLKNTENRNSRYFCPLKKRWCGETELHVAHYIDRSNMSTRYDLENCHLISKTSNTFDAQIPAEGYKSLHHKDYETWLGSEKVERLKDKSKEFIIFAKQDYINKIKFFRNV